MDSSSWPHNYIPDGLLRTFGISKQPDIMSSMDKVKNIRNNNLLHAKIESASADLAYWKHFREGCIDLAAGTFGAISSVYVGQPLDTVKVKMQLFPLLHPTMGKCFMSTLRTEGVRGLYAGTSPALVANVAENAVLFAAYGYCQKAVASLRGHKSPKDLGIGENALAGFCAAFFSSLVLCPTELVKCRMQAHRETSGGSARHITPIATLREILHKNGPSGLFRGLSSTMFREMPGYCVFFGTYEAVQSVTSESAFNTFVAGGCAGACLWTTVFPFDVIKSRQQVLGTDTSLRALATEIFRKEGALAFYNGLLPTLMRTVPATGVLLLTVEYTKRFFGSP